MKESCYGREATSVTRFVQLYLENIEETGIGLLENIHRVRVQNAGNTKYELHWFDRTTDIQSHPFANLCRSVCVGGGSGPFRSPRNHLRISRLLASPLRGSGSVPGASTRIQRFDYLVWIQTDKNSCASGTSTSESGVIFQSVPQSIPSASAIARLARTVGVVVEIVMLLQPMARAPWLVANLNVGSAAPILTSVASSLSMSHVRWEPSNKDALRVATPL